MAEPTSNFDCGLEQLSSDVATVGSLPEPRETPRTGPRAIFQTLDKNAPYPYRRQEYLKRLAWSLVEKTIFRFSGTRANRLRARLLRMFGAKVALTAVVRPSVHVQHPWLLEMGEYSCLGEKVTVYNLGPLAIGDHSTISQNTHLCGGTHDYTDPRLPLVRAGIRIGRGCWICADAFIGPDVSIGDNTLVGARAVVMKSVGPDVIVAGNPACVLGARSMDSADGISNVRVREPS